MAQVALVRVDSRLIHGQVVTKWMKQTSANRILVIDDGLAKDPFMARVYAMAAPPNSSVEIVSIQKAADDWKNHQLGEGRILAIFKDVQSVLRAWKAGFPVDRLQVGGIGAAPGRRNVYQNITLDQKDANDLSEMQKGGVEIYFQTIPEDKPATFESVISKVKF